MDHKFFLFDTLVDLLGLGRYSDTVVEFIAETEQDIEIITDKEDGAFDEYFKFKREGVSIYLEEDTVKSVFFYSSSKESSYTSYKNPLANGIKMGSSLGEVIALCGEPDVKGGDEVDDFFGYIPMWIKYQLAEHSLHMEFDEEQKGLVLVTCEK